MGLFSFTQEIAMDLGTANTIIITNGKIVVDEPSVVALDRRSGRRRFPGHRQCTGLHQLHRYLALLQLDQPDSGYDRSVGSFHVPLPGEEELLDHRCACYLHERSFFYLLRSGS